LPKSLYEGLQGLRQSQEPTKIAVAYQSINEIAREAPYALDGMKGSKEFTQEAGLFQYLTADRNMKPEEAIKQIEYQKTDEYKAKVKDLEKPWKERGGYEEQLSPNDVTDAFDSAFEWEPEFMPNPNQKMALFNTYKRVVWDEYVATRDFKQAKALAAKWMQANFEVSHITGNKTVMALPPEKVYGPVGGSTDWIKEQFMAKAEGHLSDNPDLLGSVWVMTDPQTKREMAIGQPPTYLAGYVDEYGRTQVFMGRNGEPDRFYPNKPAAASAYEYALKKEHKDEFKSLTEASEWEPHNIVRRLFGKEPIAQRTTGDVKRVFDWIINGPEDARD
jgi:hypothetical protein